MTGDVTPDAETENEREIQYQRATATNTNDRSTWTVTVAPSQGNVTHWDRVDWSTFPLTSGKTKIVARNRPPYRVPSTGTYLALWQPPEAQKIALGDPFECGFPRARGTSASPPSDLPDPDAADTGATISYIAQFSQDETFPAPTQVTIPAQGPAPDGPATFTFDAPTGLGSGLWYGRVISVDDEGAQSPASATHTFFVANKPTPPTGAPRRFCRPN